MHKLEDFKIGMKVKRISHGNTDCHNGTIKTITKISEAGTIYYKKGLGAHYTNWEIIEDIKPKDRLNPRLMSKEDTEGRYFKHINYENKDSRVFLDGDTWMFQNNTREFKTDMMREKHDNQWLECDSTGKVIPSRGTQEYYNYWETVSDDERCYTHVIYKDEKINVLEGVSSIYGSIHSLSDKLFSTNKHITADMKKWLKDSLFNNFNDTEPKYKIGDVLDVSKEWTHGEPTRTIESIKNGNYIFKEPGLYNSIKKVDNNKNIYLYEQEIQRNINNSVSKLPKNGTLISRRTVDIPNNPIDSLAYASNNMRNKENNMKDNKTTIELKINGKDINLCKEDKVCKEKTALEEAPKWLTVWYDPDGKRTGEAHDSPKQAAKLLQKPEFTGCTFISYKRTVSRTTSIPVVDC